MSDTNDTTIRVSADLNQPLSAAERLAREFTEVTERAVKLEQALKKALSAEHFQGMVRGVEDYSRRLERATKSLEKVSQNLTPRKLGAVTAGHNIDSEGNVTVGRAAKNDAVTKRIIREMENTSEQMVARIAEATLRGHQRGLKSTNDMIAAQIRQQIEQRDQLLRRTTNSALAASRARFNEMMRQAEVQWNPRNLGATERLFDYRMEQHLANSLPGVLAAKGARANANRTTLLNTWGDANYVQNVGLVNVANQDLIKKKTADLAYQQALVLDKERKYLQERAELLDQQLQDTRDQKRVYSNRRLRQTHGNAEWVAGREAQDAHSDRVTREAGTQGVYSARNSDTLRRISNNGGADMIAIQSRIMTGYMALSGAINTARSLSSFVAELDKQFKQFQAITATTSGEMVQIKKDLISVSEQTKFTALEVAQAATVLGQAGLSAQNVRESIESITLLATAAGSDLNSAVEVTTSTLSIFNLQADQAAQIANTLTAALNGSKLTMDKVTLGLQYAGNTAAQFGVTYQELISMMGAMANSGIKSGSTLGTGLRMLLVSLTEPTKKFRAELEKLGLTEADVDVKSKGLVGVMQSLKDAGFGASEAYRSFEVRAASAFAALSNNLELGIKLEESFIASSAAIKANEVQMQSLANQIDVFKSALGTVAYNSMTPLIEILRDGIMVGTSFLKVLNEIPGTMQVLSVALAGGGLFLGLKTLGALGRGLGSAIGVAGRNPIGAATDGYKLAGAAALSMGTSFNVAQKAAYGLGFAMNSIPLLGWISLAGAAATAIYAFANRTSETEQKLERLNSLINTSSQQLDTLGQEASSIDQTILNLRERQQELGDNPLQRQLKIREVISQFSELASSIDVSTASVQDLIDALSNLKTVNLESQLSEINRMNSEILAQQEMLSARINVPGFVRQAETQKILGSGFWSPGYVSPTELANRAKPLLEQVGFNQPDIVYTASNLLNNRRMFRDDENVTSYLNQIQSARSVLERESFRTSGDERKKFEAAAEGVDRLYKAMRQAAEDILTYQDNVRKLERNQLLANPATALTQLQKFTSIPSLAGSSTDILSSQIKTALQIYKDPKASPGQLTEAQQALSDVLANVTADMEAAIADIPHHLMETTKDQTLEAVNNLLNTSNYSKTLAEAGNALVEIETLRNQLTTTTLNSALNNSKKLVSDLEKRLSRSTSQTETEGIIRELTQELERQRGYERRLNELALEAAEDANTRLEVELREKEQQTANEEAISALAKERRDRFNALAIESQKGVIASIDAQIAEAQRQLADTKAKLDSAGAGFDTSGLVSTFEGVMNTLKMLQGARLDAQQTLNSFEGDGSALAWLAAKESGGSGGFSARNQYNYVGRFQFGTQRLQDYLSAQGGGQASAAQANAFKTQLLASPDLQRQVERWHFNEISQRIDKELADLIGTVVSGVVMDKSAMTGYAHLLGFGALKQFMRSGIPGVDGNMTSGITYAKAMSGRSLNYDVFDANYSSDLTARAALNTKHDQELKDVRDREATRALDVKLHEAGRNVDRLVSLTQQASTVAEIDKIISQILASAAAKEQVELQKFDVENPNNPLGRQKLQESLRAETAATLDSAFKEVLRVMDDASKRAVDIAKARLEEAQRPENIGRYSTSQMLELQQAVDVAERTQLTNNLAQAEKQVAFYKDMQAQAIQKYGFEAAATLPWATKLAETERELANLRQQVGIRGEIAGGGGGNTPYQKAYDDWFMNSSEVGADGKLLTDAQKVERAWSDVLGTLNNGFGDFFMSMGEGFDGMANSARNMGLMVVQTLMKITSQALATKSLMMVQNALPGLFGPAVNVASAGVPRLAASGDYRVMGRDSVPYLLEPGEAVLRRSAVSIVGAENIKELNNLGNRVQNPVQNHYEPQVSVPGVTNVWVVTPDQKPQMTDKDVVAIVSDDILNRGPIKKLIASVQSGA